MFSLRSNTAATPEPISAEDLARDLGEKRAASDTRRSDELTRERSEAAHRRQRADLGVETRIEDLARAEREAEAVSAARVSRMYREALAAGERTRIESQIRRSGESRALTLEKLRALNLKVLVPVLTAFGAWSTTGVQDGAARVMHAAKDAPMWWVLWLLEPALLGAVAWIIIARARLASAGGKLEWKAELVGAGCLATSITLCVISALPKPGEHPTSGAVIGNILAHVVGPIGAAVTAYLLGVVDRSISDADPWTDKGEAVPSLAKMDLRPPRIVIGQTASETAHTVADEPAHIGVDQQGRPADVAAGSGAHIDRAHAARRAAGDATRRRVLDYLDEHPDATTGEIATELDVSPATVRRYRPRDPESGAESGQESGEVAA